MMIHGTEIDYHGWKPVSYAEFMKQALIRGSKSFLPMLSREKQSFFSLDKTYIALQYEPMTRSMVLVLALGDKSTWMFSLASFLRRNKIRRVIFEAFADPLPPIVRLRRGRVLDLLPDNRALFEVELYGLNS